MTQETRDLIDQLKAAKARNKHHQAFVALPFIDVRTCKLVLHYVFQGVPITTVIDDGDVAAVLAALA